MTKGKDTKPHIGILGKRNSGKSSLINILANQDIAIVSDIAGTTTDPVKKSIEIPGIGPVILVDTAGIDDIGELGEKRVEKTMQTLSTIDAAIVIVTDNYFSNEDQSLISKLEELDIPFLIAHNKSDIHPVEPNFTEKINNELHTDVVSISALNATGIEPLLQKLKIIIPQISFQSKSMIGSLLKYGDTVLLITPIDIEAPEGRLILPQIQMIRDILDNDCIAVVTKERDMDTYIRKMSPKPALAITDSQVFLKADASIPKDIPLTSFSIVLAHHKGDFTNYLKGTPKIDELKDGDHILILESCTHHVSCDDIGRIKIPRWLTNYTGKKLEFEIVAGLSKLPGKITDFALVVQCGGCMITRKQIINRLKPAIDADIPVTNYGMTIAWVHGMYRRAVAPFVALEGKGDYL